MNVRIDGCDVSSRLVRKFSAVLKGDGITTALLHPGKSHIKLILRIKKAKTLVEN